MQKAGGQIAIKGFFRITPQSVPNFFLNIPNLAGLKAHIYYFSPNKSVQEPQTSTARGKKMMSSNARSLKYLLGWLIAGTRGGPTRAKIIEALKETPLNANQLATMLSMDYKTMRHHLEVLEKNKIITSVGDRYGATYFLTQTMEDNFVLFEEIMKKIGKK